MKRKIKMIAGIVMVMVLICAFMVPFGASDSYGSNSTINYIYDTQEYRLDAWGWAYSDTTDFHAEITVYIGSTMYDYGFDHGHAGDPMAWAAAQGAPCPTPALASQYRYEDDCAPGYY